MSASAYSEEDIKKRLELTIFVGFDVADSKDQLPEKLLYHCLVNEEKAAKASSKKAKDDDSDEETPDATKKEQRCICLTSKFQYARIDPSHEEDEDARAQSQAGTAIQNALISRFCLQRMFILTSRRVGIWTRSRV